MKDSTHLHCKLTNVTGSTNMKWEMRTGVTVKIIVVLVPTPTPTPTTAAPVVQRKKANPVILVHLHQSPEIAVMIH